MDLEFKWLTEEADDWDDEDQVEEDEDEDW